MHDEADICFCDDCDFVFGIHQDELDAGWSKADDAVDAERDGD